jgi:alanine dehydrogenase
MTAISIPFFGETEAIAALSLADIIALVEEAFTACASGHGLNFPVVRTRVGDGAIFGIKSGHLSGGPLGLKAGGYWPDNERLGLTNHQSVILLFNPGTGQPIALVGANHLTALRTAAATAVSITRLARPGATTLGIIGAGRQALHQIRASLAVGSFERVMIWSRTQAHAASLAKLVDAPGAKVEIASLETVCRAADVLVTITSAAEPLVKSEWIRPGTHVAAMGTDTKGKQELDPALFPRSAVFTDEVAQAVSIGETQNAVRAGLISADWVQAIGNVISGAATGRTSDDDITLFDGTGIALQDILVAARLVGLSPS